MTNLKELRHRIKSIHSSRKITAAMKMIAAAKLKKAQDRLIASRPYAGYLAQMMDDLIKHLHLEESAKTSLLLAGTGHSQKHLVIVVTSNRGLCGGFNSTIVRKARQKLFALQAKKKGILVLCIGRKGYDQLRRAFSPVIIAVKPAVIEPLYSDAEVLAEEILLRFYAGEFDECHIIYNGFISPLKQEITLHRLIPFTSTGADLKKGAGLARGKDNSLQSAYEYEPSQKIVLSTLLLKNLKTQLHSALQENSASEHGARMAAMDGATRNATDMLKQLALTYNRTRQAYITNELTEIVSGANIL